MESALRGWIFDKYLLLYQFFIKYQLYVGNLQSFPSLMTTLLTQCFYFINLQLLQNCFIL